MKNLPWSVPPRGSRGPVPGAVPPRARCRLREGSAQRGAGVAAAPPRAQRNADRMETAGAAGWIFFWGVNDGIIY